MYKHNNEVLSVVWACWTDNCTLYGVQSNIQQACVYNNRKSSIKIPTVNHCCYTNKPSTETYKVNINQDSFDSFGKADC